MESYFEALRLGLVFLLARQSTFAVKCTSHGLQLNYLRINEFKIIVRLPGVSWIFCFSHHVLIMRSESNVTKNKTSC